MVFFSVGNVLIWPRMPFTYQKSLANWNLFYDCSQAWSGFLGFNFDHQITNKDYLVWRNKFGISKSPEQSSCPVFRKSHVSFFFQFPGKWIPKPQQGLKCWFLRGSKIVSGLKFFIQIILQNGIKAPIADWP